MFKLTLHGRISCYSITANGEKVKSEKPVFSVETGIFQPGEEIMKKKTIAALTVLRDITSENLGFVLVWAAALAVILKLACV